MIGLLAAEWPASAADVEPERTLIVVDASASMSGFCHAEASCGLTAVIQALIRSVAPRSEDQVAVDQFWALYQTPSDQSEPVCGDRPQSDAHAGHQWYGLLPTGGFAAATGPFRNGCAPWAWGYALSHHRDTDLAQIVRDARTGALDNQRWPRGEARHDLAPAASGHTAVYRNVFIVTDGAEDRSMLEGEGNPEGLLAEFDDRVWSHETMLLPVVDGVRGVWFDGFLYPPHERSIQASVPPDSRCDDLPDRIGCDALLASSPGEVRTGFGPMAWLYSSYRASYTGPHGLVIIGLVDRSRPPPTLSGVDDTGFLPLWLPHDAPAWLVPDVQVAQSRSDGGEVDVTATPPPSLSQIPATQWWITGATTWSDLPAWGSPAPQRVDFVSSGAPAASESRAASRLPEIPWYSALTPWGTAAVWDHNGGLTAASDRLLVRVDVGTVGPYGVVGANSHGVPGCRGDRDADWADPRRPYGLGTLVCRTLLDGRTSRDVELSLAESRAANIELHWPGARLCALGASAAWAVLGASVGAVGLGGAFRTVACVLVPPGAHGAPLRWLALAAAGALAWAGLLLVSALAFAAGTGWVVFLPATGATVIAILWALQGAALAQVGTFEPESYTRAGRAAVPPGRVAGGEAMTSECALLSISDDAFPVDGPPRLVIDGPTDRVELGASLSQHARIACALLPDTVETVFVDLPVDSLRELKEALAQPYAPVENPGLQFPRRPIVVVSVRDAPPSWRTLLGPDIPGDRLEAAPDESSAANDAAILAEAGLDPSMRDPILEAPPSEGTIDPAILNAAASRHGERARLATSQPLRHLVLPLVNAWMADSHHEAAVQRTLAAAHGYLKRNRFRWTTLRSRGGP